VLVNNFGESNPRKDLDITKCTYKEFEKTVCVDLSTVFNRSAIARPMPRVHAVTSATFPSKRLLITVHFLSFCVRSLQLCAGVRAPAQSDQRFAP